MTTVAGAKASDSLIHTKVRSTTQRRAGYSCCPPVSSMRLLSCTLAPVTTTLRGTPWLSTCRWILLLLLLLLLRPLPIGSRPIPSVADHSRACRTLQQRAVHCLPSGIDAYLLSILHKKYTNDFHHDFGPVPPLMIVDSTLGAVAGRVHGPLTSAPIFVENPGNDRTLRQRETATASRTFGRSKKRFDTFPQISRDIAMIDMLYAQRVHDLSVIKKYAGHPPCRVMLILREIIFKNSLIPVGDDAMFFYWTLISMTTSCSRALFPFFSMEILNISLHPSSPIRLLKYVETVGSHGNFH